MSGRLTPFQDEVAHAIAAREPRLFLTGGAVLVGWLLRHRTTDDLDFFTDEDEPAAGARAVVEDAAAGIGASVRVLQTSPSFHRFAVSRGEDTVVVDVVRDRVPQLHEKAVVDAIRMDGREEIFVNKICALVSRSEVRDLVDVLELEARGLRVEDFLAAAAKKDGGVTPATLAWLLSTFPIPDAVPGARGADELRRYAKDLEVRMAALARPSV